MTIEVKHFTRWYYDNDQYRDTEIWLWRYTIYRVLGVKVWVRRERKVYLPIWSWAATPPYSKKRSKRWRSRNGL